MLSIEGYRIVEKLDGPASRQVFAGVRLCDGARVVLKTYAEDAECPPKESRAGHEYALLRRIHAPGVVRALALEECDGAPVLVMERVSGVSLTTLVERGELRDPSRALRVAVGIARSLLAVHEAKILHRDVKPSNLLVDPETLDVCLVDFGISAEIGATRGLPPCRMVEGTLRYISPEQTGRVAIGVDFRSDLYALGATLYELFTGSTPFTSDSSIELINAHLSVVPTPPHCMSSAVPKLVSDIVMRLLEKEPERRYQSAYGLCEDLKECIARLRSDGSITPEFPLGSHDGTDRLRFPRSIQGRTRERAVLEEVHARVLRGGTEVVVISGPAGIGKSSLAETLGPLARAAGGYLAHGNFDSKRSQAPFSGLSRLFASLTDQLLAERSDRFDFWREHLRNAVDPIGASLRPLVPDLELVTGPLAEVPPLGAREARDRMSLALERFTSAIAMPGRGLVLVLDDVQWADPASLELLLTLLGSPRDRSLMLVMTLRAEQAEAVRATLARVPESVPLHDVALGPLDIADVNALIAGALGRSPAETLRLAEVVAVKTGRHPLLVCQILEVLRDRGVLRYENGSGWDWDAEALTGIDVLDDVATYLVLKLESLPARWRELLTLAASLGDTFQLEDLFAIAGGDRIELLQSVTGLAEQGVLAPCRDGFRFGHERIREAVLGRVEVETSTRLHLEIARMLLSRTPPDRLDARAFEIADHLNRAPALLETSDRESALDINLRAGRRAMRECAAESAVHYFAHARTYGGDTIFAAQPRVAFDLYLQSAESALQVGDPDACIEHLSTVEGHTWDRVSAAQVAAKKFSAYLLRDGSDRVADLALSLLRDFGIPVPRKLGYMRTRLAVAWTDWRLRGALELDRFAAESPGPGNLRIAQSIVLIATAPALASSSFNHYMYVHCTRVWDALDRGRVPAVAMGILLSAYHASRMNYVSDCASAERHLPRIEEWLASAPGAPITFVGQYLLHAFLYPALRGHRGAAAIPESLLRSLLETGEGTIYSISLFVSAAHLAVGGAPLADVVRKLTALSAYARRGEPMPNRWMLRALRLITARDEAIADDHEVEELSTAFASRGWGRVGTRAAWLMVLVVLGRFDHVLRLAQEEHRKPSLASFKADARFYLALAASAAAVRRPWRQRRRLRRVVRRETGALEVIARTNPEVVHMAVILRAELAALRGRAPDALALYTRASDRAKEVGYVHHAALVSERRIALLRRIGRIHEAEGERDRCARLYEAWGAHRKAELLMADPLAPPGTRARKRPRGARRTFPS